MMGAMPPPPAADPADPQGLAAWGIEPGYQDVFGGWQEPGPETVRRLRRAMGATSDDPAERPPPATPLQVLRPGEQVTPTGPATLVLEDGTRLVVEGATPPDLPLGYHRLEQETVHGPAIEHLVVSPGRSALPPELRVWGITAQLYAARSSHSWGIGDLADLRRLIDWATERGAGVVGLNPLHAPDPLPRQPNSPYSPSSRRWRDPLYLAVEDVPGAAGLPDLAELVAAGRALGAGERIDRSAVWAHKRAALEELWSGFAGDPAFDRYRAEHGADLTTWATYCALVDHHGSGWHSWPAGHQEPDSIAVTRFTATHAGEVGFWSWLQWLLDEQLRASGAGDVVVADLAVGFDADGADAWQWQDLLAEGVRIGAPPDLYGPEGQDWGLPPFIPWKLREAAYQPFASTIRAVARHARGLRIDHVMGLFRLLWIPPAMGAAEGAYVRFHGKELLDVVALESVRAGAIVVGEDLGTVEPGVREVLADAGVLSTRLLWFEDDAPSAWPRQAMAAISTHDLPTAAGLWTGVDLADQRAAGVTLPPDGDDTFRHHLRVAAGSGDSAPVDEVVLAAHRALAEAPSMVVTATMDDLLGAEHRPNLPGTVDEHPNWRIPLPVLLDDLPGDPRAEAIADVFRSAVPDRADDRQDR
ncbi:4-alpha-glucanotransferase [soil metagenome]